MHFTRASARYSTPDIFPCDYKRDALAGTPCPLRRTGIGTEADPRRNCAEGLKYRILKNATGCLTVIRCALTVALIKKAQTAVPKKTRRL